MPTLIPLFAASMSLNDLVTGSSNLNRAGAGGILPVSCTPGAQLINNVPINCGINTSLAAGASGDEIFSFTMPQVGTFTNDQHGLSRRSCA